MTEVPDSEWRENRDAYERLRADPDRPDLDALRRLVEEGCRPPLVDADLSDVPLRDLLALRTGIDAEISRRGYARTATSLSGEVMEHVVAHAYGDGTLPTATNQGWDVLAIDGRRIQVKNRNLPAGVRRPFRFGNVDFDLAVLALTDRDTNDIVWAREVTIAEMNDLLRPHGADGFSLTFARARAAGSDITERLREVYATLH